MPAIRQMAGRAANFISRRMGPAFGPRVPLGNRVGRFAGRMGAVGRAVSNAPGVKKAGMGLLIGGAAVAGLVAGTKSIFDAAQDVAFDDPEADRKFTGQDFGPGFYASQMVGGPVASAGRALSPLGAGGRAKAAFMTGVGGIAATAGGISLAAGGFGAIRSIKRFRQNQRQISQ